LGGRGGLYSKDCTKAFPIKRDEGETMARTPASADVYYAKITNDNGTVRGKIPSPLVRDMKARPGDKMVFRKDDAGNVIMSVLRGKGRRARKSAKKQDEPG
jgi:hypothetical protein